MLAEITFRTGDYETVAENVDAALKLDENHVVARWWQTELHRVTGKIEEATNGYGWFVDYYNDNDVTNVDDLRTIGMAAAQYARWKRNKQQFRFLVSNHYPSILARNKNYWPAHLEAGRLFLEKFLSLIHI